MHDVNADKGIATTVDISTPYKLNLIVFFFFKALCSALRGPNGLCVSNTLEIVDFIFWDFLVLEHTNLKHI